MSQTRLLSPPHLAPRQHSGSTDSTTKDSSYMALGPTASRSKVSPQSAPYRRCSVRDLRPRLSLKLLTVVRALLRPHSSQMGLWALDPRLLPTRPGKLSRKGSGPIWRRKCLNRELRPHSPLGTGLTSSLTSLRMICVGLTKISLVRRVLPAPSSPGNTSRLPYTCMA